MLKRCFSLIVAFAMVFSLLPVQAFAEGTPEAEGEQPVQETQVIEPVSDPEPETEPAPAETDPVPVETDPVPAETEPAPAETDPVPVETDPVPVETEPVPIETEPVPAETVPEETVAFPEEMTPTVPAMDTQATEPATVDAGEVTFEFRVMGDTTIVAPVTVAMGGFIELPDCTAEYPDLVFGGWALHRSDGAVLSVDSIFVTNDQGIVELEPGATIEVTADLFDPDTYGYYFDACWYYTGVQIQFCFKPLALNHNVSGMLAQDEQIIQIPACTEQNTGHTFAGWYLADPGGAWLTADGEFTLDESKSARLFTPGEYFTVDTDFFNENMIYTFQGVWEDAVIFTNSDRSEATTIKYGDDLVFPGDADTTWVIQRSDSRIMIADGAFDDVADLHEAWINPGGGTLSVLDDFLDGTKYTYTLFTFNEGMGEGGGEGSSTYVTTEDELRTALADAQADSHVWVEADITLTSDVNVPEDVYLHIDENATLTVSEGVVLSVDGTIYVNDGLLNLASGAVLTVGENGWISVDVSGKLQATGADLSGVDYIWVSISGEGQITGVPASKLEGSIRVRSFAQLKEVLPLAEGYRFFNLICCDEITVTEDLTLPRNVVLEIANDWIWDEEAEEEVEIHGNFIIAPGVTVTASNHIGVMRGCTLTVSEGALLNSGGSLEVYNEAKVVNNGTIAVRSYYFYEGHIYEGTGEIVTYKEPGLTEEGLREALSEDEGRSVSLTEDITLTADLTIPKYFNIQVRDGATLTVPAGITLTMEGDLYIDGTVKVEPGASIVLIDNDWNWLGVWSGTLDVAGADISQLDLNKVELDLTSGGQVIGIPATELNARCSVENVGELKEAAALAGMYRRVNISIYDTITVTEDLEIPENVYITLWGAYNDVEAALVIASGVNLTTYGNLQVGDDATLNVESGSQLTVVGFLSANSTAKIINNGTIAHRNYHFDDGCTYEGTGEMIRYKEPGMNEEALRAALTGENTWIQFTGNITLTGDLVIPRGYSLSLEEEASIDVPAGISLIVEGDLNIYDGAVTVAPGGSLVTVDNGYSWVNVGWYGRLDVTGSDTSGIIPGRIHTQLGSNGVITGIPTTMYNVTVEVEDTEDILAGLAVADQYNYVNLSTWRTFSITEDLVLPRNVNLNLNYSYHYDEFNNETIIYADVTIAPGVAVTARNGINLQEGTTLTISEGSELYLPGWLYVWGGTVVNNGTIYETANSVQLGDGGTIKGSGKRLPYEAPPMTEDELRAEVEKRNGYAELTGNMTLTADLTIAEESTILLQKGAVLTVPAGVTLTVEGMLDIVDGKVKVEEGGTFCVTEDGWFKVYVGEEGYLDVTGADISGIAAGKIYFIYPHSSNIQGIPADQVTVAAAVNTYADLTGVLAVADQYHSAYAEIQKSLTISKDLYIPYNAIVDVYAFYNNSTGKTTPSKVTISSGATITNDGVIAVYNDCTLTVNSGCEIYNGAGYLDVVSSATLVNNGTITSSSENIYFDDGATIKGSGKFNIIEELVDTSVEEILAAYENGSTVLRILGSTIKFTESIELPKDLKLEFIQSTVTISEGVTVTAAAELAVSLYDNSTLYLDGTFSGKEIFLSNDSAVEPAAKIVSARDAAAGGRYVKLGLPKATALNIFEIVDGAYGGTVNGETLSIDMKDQPTFQLGSSTEPFYASNDVTWKSSSTSIATVDAAGLVTFKKPGTVTITATTKDGSKISASVKFAVTYLDKATKLTAAAEVPTIGLQESFTTTMLVYGTDKEIPLDPADLTFTISPKEAEIASVDENGVITAGTKAGTATVTAAITGDPLGRKISVKVKVIALQTNAVYLEPVADEIVTVIMEDENGEVTEDVRDAIKIDVYLDEADVAAETYDIQIGAFVSNARDNMAAATKGSLKWSSSDTKVATVKENADGTATVTVKAKTDGACAITAAGNDLQKAQKIVTIHVCDYSPRIDTTSVTLNTNMVTGAKVPVVESYGNNITNVTIHEYDSAAKAYAEEPSKRLAVIPAEYGVMEIIANDVIAKNQTIKTQVRITCANDRTYAYNISVKVANTLPAITVKQPVKFNLHTGLATELTITAKNAVVEDVNLDPESTASFYQAADFDAEAGILYLAASDEYLGGEVAMDAKVDVVISLEGYREPITKAVTIGTSSTKPTVTVKQPAKFNLFYSSSVAQLQVTFKGMEGIEKVELDPTSTASFEQIGEFDFEHGTLAIKQTEAYLNKEVKLDTSAKLLVYPVGRETPITKTFTISTVTTKPSVKLSAASSIINTALDDKTTSFTVVDNAGTLPLTEEYVTVTAAFADAAVEDGAIKLTLKETNGKYSGGTATIMVQMPGWTQAIKLTHKVTVQTALPTPTLGASTLKLNRIFTETTAETTVKLNQSNQKIGDIEFKAVTKGAEDIVLTYEDGIIKAAFAEDMETAPKNGNYKFDYVVTLDNEAGTKLAKKSITVNVASTVPTVKLKTSTLKLNKNLSIYASAETAVTMSNGTGYELVGMVAPESDIFEVEYETETGMLHAYLLDETAAVKNHAVNLYPVVRNEATGQEVQLTTAVKATVSVKADKISISVSAKGKLDTMNPDSSINYTVTKLTNIVGDVVDVTLAGDDAELFDVALDTTGKPVAVLTRKDSAEVATNKTYKLQLVFAVAVNTRDGIENYYVVSNVSFKVSQSALKFAAVPAMKLYHSSSDPISCTVALTSPAGAKIESIALSSKSALQFSLAMGVGEIEIDYADDGRSAEISFNVKNPGYLVNGKSYTVYLDITPANNATNVKPTQVKLTVKAYK